MYRIRRVTASIRRIFVTQRIRIDNNTNTIANDRFHDIINIRGGSEGSRPTPAPAHGRCYTYVLNSIDVVITIIYSQKYVLFEIMYTYIASFHIATTWCKGHIFGILSTPINSPVICLKCKETHLKFHSTSSTEPSLLFFLHTPLNII